MDRNRTTWKEYFKKQGSFVLEVNSQSGAGIKAIHGSAPSLDKPDRIDTASQLKPCLSDDIFRLYIPYIGWIWSSSLWMRGFP